MFMEPGRGTFVYGFLFKFYILGTFQAETDEEIAYGLVHPLASWDPIYTQVRTSGSTSW